jgi:hypothetical protein
MEETRATMITLCQIRQKLQSLENTPKFCLTFLNQLQEYINTNCAHDFIVDYIDQYDVEFQEISIPIVYCDVCGATPAPRGVSQNCAAQN